MPTQNHTYRPTVSAASSAATYSLFPVPYSLNFTFSAKERDVETGLSYFGSRYYSSDLSIWLSVDPMASKYPGLSPYVYCANNPVKLVDPNGETVIVSGDGAEEVVNQLNNVTSKNFTLDLNENGEMVCFGKAKTRTDRLIKKAINSNKETVNIVANNSNEFTDRNDEKHSYSQDDSGGGFYGGGAYGGSVVSDKHSTSYQYVNPKALANLDKLVGDKIVGKYMLHEFAEGFFSAKIGHRTHGDNVGGDNYEDAHTMANTYAGGGWKSLVFDCPIFYPRIGYFGLTQRKIIGYRRSDE